MLLTEENFDDSNSNKSDQSKEIKESKEEKESEKASESFKGRNVVSASDVLEQLN